MAPKGGKGGSRGGKGTVSSCPNAFEADSLGHTRAEYFAAYCVFFVIFLVILVYAFSVRKKHAVAKRLVGPIYIVTLLSLLLSLILGIIATLLRECETTDFYVYYQFAIPITIFWRIGTFLMLVLFVYSVNDHLRKIHGQTPSFFKLIYAVVLGIMGALTCGVMGVECYDAWLNYDYYANYSSSRSLSISQKVLYLEQYKLSVAHISLYLVSVCVGGVLSVVTLSELRSRGNFSTLTILLGTTFFFLFMWTIFSLAAEAKNLEEYLAYTTQGDYTDSYTTYVGLAWAAYIAQSAFFVALLFLGKTDTTAAAATAAPAVVGGAAPPYSKETYGQAELLPQQQGQQPVQQQGLPYSFYTGAPPQQQGQVPVQQVPVQQGQQGQGQYYYQQQPQTQVPLVQQAGYNPQGQGHA